MKRVLFLACFLLASMFAFSQTVYYKVTVNNVVVRTGPGKNYSAAPSPIDDKACKLSKGSLVESNGKIRNGYLHVSCPYATYNWGDGWIPVQYAKKAVKCPVCKGKGTMGRECDYCHGNDGMGCRFCSYSGQESCPKCGTLGYY